MLYVLAGGILVASYSRLREGTPPPTLSVIPFIVLLADIAVNFWRARALHRTARDTDGETGDSDTSAFEHLEGLLVAHADFADEVARGHDYVVEDDFGGVGGMHAELFQGPGHLVRWRMKA